MRFVKIIAKTFITSVLLSVVTGVYAKDSDLVMCPKLDKIRQTAPLINDFTYDKYKDLYIAYTDKPAFQENNLNWAILAMNIKASSSKEAIQKGINMVSNTFVMYSEIASGPLGGSYFCVYFGTRENKETYIWALGMNDSSKQISPIKLVVSK